MAGSIQQRQRKSFPAAHPGIYTSLQILKLQKRKKTGQVALFSGGINKGV